MNRNQTLNNDENGNQTSTDFMTPLVNFIASNSIPDQEFVQSTIKVLTNVQTNDTSGTSQQPQSQIAATVAQAAQTAAAQALQAATAQATQTQTQTQQQSSSQSNSSNLDEQYDYFGKFVSSRLKAMSPSQAAMAQRSICEIFCR